MPHQVAKELSLNRKKRHLVKIIEKEKENSVISFYQMRTNHAMNFFIKKKGTLALNK